MKKSVLKIVALLLFVLASCTQQGSHQYAKHDKGGNVKVKRYHVKSSNSDDWYYMYMIMQNNVWYYQTSPTQVSSFTTSGWVKSTTSPIEEKEVQEEGEQEISTEELSEELQTEIAADPETDAEYDGGVDEAADSYDGGSNDSDSGGGDSGGGDSGGGDSGGD